MTRCQPGPPAGRTNLLLRARGGPRAAPRQGEQGRRRSGNRGAAGRGRGRLWASLLPAHVISPGGKEELGSPGDARHGLAGGAGLRLRRGTHLVPAFGGGVLSLNPPQKRDGEWVTRARDAPKGPVEERYWFYLDPPKSEQKGTGTNVTFRRRFITFGYKSVGDLTLEAWAAWHAVSIDLEPRGRVSLHVGIQDVFLLTWQGL